MSEESTDLRIARYEEITLEWDIKDILKVTTKNGESLDSSTVSFSNAGWCLRIYPNGRDENCCGWVSFYLRKNTAPTGERQVAYSLGLKKTDGSIFKCWDVDCTFKENEFQWGFRNFVSRQELRDSNNRVTSDGVLIFHCTARGRWYSKENSASPTLLSDGVETLSKNFKELFLSERICDVKIKVKALEFKAHKSVLLARSSVFASMFEHEMAESISGVVDIIDCESESFQSFLLFLYSGKLDFVAFSSLVGLYHTADKYDVKELKEECCQRLTDEMSVDLVCDAVHLAVVYNEAELLDTATQFFITNAHGVLTTAKWKEFMVESSSIANELLIKLALYKAEPKSNE